MSDVKVKSGWSSSATHRATQSSQILDRRYVPRPSNSAIDEAAKGARKAHSSAKRDNNSAPSRLVNLRVHAADFEAARAAEAERMAMEEAEAARILATTNQIALYPNVVEFGTNPVKNSTDAMAAGAVATDLGLAAAAGTPSFGNTTAFNPFSSSTPSAPVDMDALAMNIAADYAAASLGASVKEYGDNYSGYAIASETAPSMTAAMTEAPAVATLSTSALTSVDAIATAASEAIASIRVATDPTQVSEQVSSLKTFAENIKANHNSPEMRELGDTIEKFVSIAMKSTKVQEENAAKANTAVKITLPAKANRAANKVTKSSAKAIAINRKKVAMPTQSRNMMSRSTSNSRIGRHHTSPEELKDRAIERALHSVATMDEEHNRRTKARAAYAMPRKRFRARHFAVAFACAAACVAGIIYVVGSNIPDITVRVAAMQTGMQATYPSYVPRDYSLGDITSENGKITLKFDGPDGASFVLSEEKSSWDSAALLRNYVEPTWGEDYTTTHEQGITIYISNVNSDAAWVNGGVLYKITSSKSILTKKQVRSIVTSL